MDNSARIPAVIFDVDGTLCDVRQIRHFVERPVGAERFRPSFALFHSESEDCPAFPRVAELVSALAREGYAIVIVTAREARWAELTERWLNRHGIPRHELIARRELDYRSDAVVKAEMCADIQSRYKPRLAVDDRDDILAVWARASIPTVKVDHVGLLSGIKWPARTRDDRLEAIVEGVRGAVRPSPDATGGQRRVHTEGPSLST